MVGGVVALGLADHFDSVGIETGVCQGFSGLLQNIGLLQAANFFQMASFFGT
jgi:hypothetical protein